MSLIFFSHNRKIYPKTVNTHSGHKHYIKEGKKRIQKETKQNPFVSQKIQDTQYIRVYIPFNLLINRFL